MSDEPRFEHDGPDDPFDLEETEKALQAERDERDEHVAEREELGFPLLWWRDNSLLEAHQAMGDLFDATLCAVSLAKALRTVGLTEDAQTVVMKLNLVSGPLVASGLQLLGMYFPELREEITATLASIPISSPTDDEASKIKAALAELERREAEVLEKNLRRLQDENFDAGMN